jgi:RNA polymerase sigma-70 factor (ECF subfamily)
VEIPDEELCERVAAGDDAAFDLLVERHRERAHRLAWSIVRNAEEARDLSQEAFIRLYRTAGSFKARARFSTWFFRIVVNLCLDHLRRDRWWRRMLAGPPQGARGHDDGPSAIERVPSPDAGVDANLTRTETMTALWSAVDRLSPQQRAAVLLQIEGLPTGEIAGVLGCSEATVRVHLHRALLSLRARLGGR